MILNKLLNNDKAALNRVKKGVEPILALADKYSSMSDEGLKTQTGILKGRLASGETLDDILPDAFAVAREAAKRVLGEYPYPSQLMGGYVLHNGDISEQLTGSGKTLTAVLPAYLNALEGKGVHVITVNEYLAERDADRMGRIFQYLGLSVGLNVAGMSPAAKRFAYGCDITYTSNSELGFDYLRDNMVTDKKDRVLRGLNYAIIDEIDSILIDDARTPLIISGKPEQTDNYYVKANNIAKLLVRDKDFTYDPRDKACMLTEEGIKSVETLLGIDNLYSVDNASMVHYLKQALQANYVMIKDIDYIINDKGEIMIVDPNTGRTMEGRQWSNGLHQAIQAKEGVEIKQENRTVASITYQNLFRLYKKLSGMSGTAKTEEEEFLATYNMRVIQIPPNNPVIRVDYPDYVFGTKKAKYKAVVDEVVRLHAKGQPVLVGTVAIETSELLSKMLKERNIPHNVLNAKNHALEAEIISHAGQKGAVTIATNMAGRGTDIKLGEGVKELGGLAIIGTERHKSRRIDNQLRGRSGRQGDPGFSRFYVSVQDDLMVQFGSERLEDTFAKLGDEKVESKLITNSITAAQERVEGINFDARKKLLEYDDVLRVQRETIYESRDRVLDNDNIHDFVCEIFRRTIHRIVYRDVTSDKQKIDDEIAKRIVLDLRPLECPYVINPKELVGADRTTADKALADYFIFVYETKIKGLEELMTGVEKHIVLKFIDTEWSEHIAIMDELRNNIGLRGYAQIDPLKEYVNEGYTLFEEMMEAIDEDIVKFCMQLKIEIHEETEETADVPKQEVKEETPAKNSQESVANSKMRVEQLKLAV